MQEKEEENEEALMGIADLFNETDIEENIKVNPEIELLEEPIVNSSTLQREPPKCVNDYGHNFKAKKISKIVLKKPSEYNEKLNYHPNCSTYKKNLYLMNKLLLLFLQNP